MKRHINFKGLSRDSAQQPLALVLLWSIMLSACSDGSNRVASQLPVETSELVLDITFPPNSTSTEGVAEITVSGTLADVGDGELSADDIQRFTVNGIPVNVDFSLGRWQAEVSLGITDSAQLAAVLESASGQILEKTVAVSNTPLQGDYKLLRLFADGSSALVYGSGQLRRVDLVSGAETPVVGQLIDGYLAPMTGVRIDATASNAYLLRWDFIEPGSDAYSVDLGDNTGRHLGSLGYPGYVDTVFYHGFDLDDVNSQLVFSRKTGDALHGINGDSCSLLTRPLSGGPARELAYTSGVSALPGAPSVPFCAGPVLVDAANNRVIAAADETAYPQPYFPAPEEYGLYAYDLASGVGSVLSEATSEQGPLLYAPNWLFLSGAGERVLAVDEEQVLWVDLTSGVRSIALENPSMPKEITDIDYDEVGQRLIIAHDLNSLSALSLSTGDLHELLRVDIEKPIGEGAEVPWGSRPPLSIVDSQRNRLYIFDEINEQLVSVDLTSLKRTVLATGLPTYMSAAVLDPSATHLYYIASSSDKLMRLDIETGIRDVVTSASIGAGIPLRNITGLSVDSSRGLLYASGDIGRGIRNGLVSVDINTGARKLIMEVPVHELRLFRYGHALQLNLYDADGDRVLVTTRHGNVLAIDLESGKRSRIYRRLYQDDPIYSIAWDSTPGRILIGVELHTVTPMQVRSVELESGAVVEVTDEIARFAFDPSRALFYSVEDLLRNGERGQAFAIDRYSGDMAVIARSP